jgi:hypothetical protein
MKRGLAGPRKRSGKRNLPMKDIHPRAHSRKKIDANKLAKLFRLLASDKDGEVIATVAAIKRTLDTADLDLHDLADAVEARFKKPDKQRTPAKWAPPAPDTSYWESMAWWAHYYRQHLSTSDREYVAGVLMGEHFDCGRADAAMMSRLRSIVAKIGAAQDADW